MDTEAGPTDVMSAYPEEDELEPTVALVEDEVDEEEEEDSGLPARTWRYRVL